MKSKTFPTEKSWSYLFTDTILERGRDYYEDGAVDELSVDPDENTVSATVSGSTDYETVITLSGDWKRVIYMECDCPYAEDGNNCKHMAAVLFAMQDESGSEPEYSVNQDTDRNALSAELADAVNRLSLEELRKYVMEAAEEDTSLRDRLLFACGKPVSATRLDKWKQELDDIIDEAQDRHGWVDDLGDLSHSLYLFLDEKVDYLRRQGSAEEAFRLVCAAYDAYASCEGDDSNGEYADFFECCREYWDELLDGSTAELRRAVYPWFEATDGDDLYEWAFHYMLSTFTDEEFLRRQLGYLDRLISEAGTEREYWLESLVKKRLERMELLGISEEEKAAYRRSYFALPCIREQEINAALSRRDYETAEALLRDSIELDHGKWGLIDDYHIHLIELFTVSGQTEKYECELRTYVLENCQSDLTYIKKLKEITPSAQWETVREQLLTDKTHARIRYDLMESEGLFRRLFDAVSSEYSDYALLQYEKTLKEHFPVELRDELLSRAEQAMKAAADRKAYARVIASLERLRTYPDGKEKLDALVRSWRERYRRPALMDELRKAGF